MGNLCGQYSFFHQSCATGTLLFQKEIYPQKSLPNLRQLIFCRLLNQKAQGALPRVYAAVPCQCLPRVCAAVPCQNPAVRPLCQAVPVPRRGCVPQCRAKTPPRGPYARPCKGPSAYAVMPCAGYLNIFWAKLWSDLRQGCHSWSPG